MQENEAYNLVTRCLDRSRVRANRMPGHKVHYKQAQNFV